MVHPLPADQILNVNVPDLPLEQIKGIRVTRLAIATGRSRSSAARIPVVSPSTGLAPRQPAGCGRRNGLCRHRAGLCSITLTIDMTAYGSLSGWARGWTCRDEGVIVQRLLNQLDCPGCPRFRVLAAIAKVPRQLFVDEAMAHKAWDNTALPIGHGQTISQPTWWRG
jgi:hypothetical protein